MRNDQLIAGSLAAIMSAFVSGTSLEAAEAHLGTGGAPDGAGSIYHQGYALPIQDLLNQELRMMLYADLELMPSAGSGANIATCAEDRQNLCFGLAQGDVAANHPAIKSGKVTVVRNDLPAECGFVFASNPQIASWRTVQKYAGKITLYLPPADSGTAITFREVLATDPSIDPNDMSIEFVEGGWEAIQNAVENDPRGIGATVRFPDPSVMLDSLADRGFQVFGVAVPEMLRLTLPGGTPVYTVNGTAPYTDPFLGRPESIATICTPAAIIATNPERIEDPILKEDLSQAITALRAANSKAFVPTRGSKARIFQTVRDLGEQAGLNQVIHWWEQEIAPAIPALEH